MVLRTSSYLSFAAAELPLPFICRAGLQPNRRHGLFISRSVPKLQSQQRHHSRPALGINENARLVVRLAASETRAVTSGDSREGGGGSLYYLREACTALCTATFKLGYGVLKSEL